MLRLPILIILFCLATQVVHAQFVPPKGFHLVKGENGEGSEDEYTNGRYTFDTHKLFRDYDYKGNDAGVVKYMTEEFGFPFYLTKDGICWGTGKQGNNYEYIVIDNTAEVIELYSPYNDAGFAKYSAWLLNTTRTYNKAGKSMIFPFHLVK